MESGIMSSTLGGSRIIFLFVTLPVAMAAVVTMAVVTMAADADVVQPGPAAASDASPAADKVNGNAGLRVHVDPRTGEFLDEPPPGSKIPAENSLESTRPALVEEPSPVAGGGTMIRLDDRFRAEFRAEVGPNGKRVTDCQQPAESR